MAFLATYSDGYRRTIAGPVRTMPQALAYAKHLEAWFNAGGNTERKLVHVQPNFHPFTRQHKTP